MDWVGCFWLGMRRTNTIPTGGYGMNTGVGDACDLGWKLAAVLRGFGGPGLLASYDAERRPDGGSGEAVTRPVAVI
jgi:2-polyprenyl-6-methoxyphenol hydroxylase-like FAD-dependent oxidoreductase